MTIQHVVYSVENNFGQWVTPATWLHVDSSTLKAARENLKMRISGFGRDVYMAVQGAKPVAGSIALPFWYTHLAHIWRTALQDWASTAVAGSVYDNDFLFDDTVANKSISFQQQWGGATATNILSAVMKAFKITAAAKAQVQVGWDFEAKDESIPGGMWDYDGSAAPALVATPTYWAPIRPLMFYDCAVKLGGTTSLVGHKITVSGGSTIKLLGTVDVGVDLGLSADDYALASPDPTRQELMPGNRTITCTLDMLWGTRDLTFYNAMRAGTPVVLELNAVGPIISGAYRSEMHLCLPCLTIDGGQLPDITADETPKRQAITGEATLDAGCGKSFGMRIRSLEHLV
jgi:hypothetical protein